MLDRPETPLNTNGSENDIRCQLTRRCGSGTSGLRQEIAVGPSDPLDHPDWKEHAEDRQQVAPADASDVDPWILQRMQ